MSEYESSRSIVHRVLGIVPARAGSVRLKDKNIRQLGDKPLVQWAMDACASSNQMTDWLVSTDDSRILDLCDALRVQGLPRPPELATDRALAIDYVKHALSHQQAAGKPAYSVVVIVQPTSPFTTGEDIDACLSLLAQNEADSVVSVVGLDHAIHPAKLKTKDATGLLHAYLEEEQGRMAAHELPELYVRNGSVYALRTRNLKTDSLLGKTSIGYEMPRRRSIDINDETDFSFAEFMLMKMQDKQQAA